MVHAMNLAVEVSKSKCKKFTNEEFFTGLGLIIGSAGFSHKEVDLFGTKKDDDNEFYQWPSISPSPQFEQFMAFSHFKEFQRFLPRIFVDESKKRVIPGGSFQVPLNNLI